MYPFKKPGLFYYRRRAIGLASRGQHYLKFSIFSIDGLTSINVRKAFPLFLLFVIFNKQEEKACLLKEYRKSSNRMKFFSRIILAILLGVISFSCGTNTDTPVYPYLFLNPINTPQIIGLIPTDSYPYPITDSEVLSYESIPYKPEFILKYYVTNTEQQFIGYNLYITSNTPSFIEVQAGSAAYLEEGIEPSFRHFTTEVSTDRTAIQRKRIKNRIPPPGLYPFQKCEVYNFTLRAVLNNGVLSNPSAAVSACASRFPSKCEIGSSCNPSYCTDSSCSSPSSCPVGTLCNPCDTTKAIDANNGCECKEGSYPPGCNL